MKVKIQASWSLLIKHICFWIYLGLNLGLPFDSVIIRFLVLYKMAGVGYFMRYTEGFMPSVLRSTSPQKGYGSKLLLEIVINSLISRKSNISQWHYGSGALPSALLRTNPRKEGRELSVWLRKPAFWKQESYSSAVKSTCSSRGPESTSQYSSQVTHNWL